MYFENDVKQFIKDLKDALFVETECYYGELDRIINKLAGDKLIKEQKEQ